MLKQLLSASSVLALLLIGNLPAAYAQTQESLPQAQMQIIAQSDVSSDELEKFASAIKQLLEIEQQSRAQIAQVIETQGFTQERFTEIYQAQRNPEQQPTPQISDEEKQKFEQVVQQAIEIRQQSQAQKEEAVQNQGLDVDRFNEILTAIQQSPELQEQVEVLLKDEAN